MTDETTIILRGEKNAGIIRSMCELYGLDMETSTDIFYKSDISTLIEDKIADLHCRSNRYLAILVMEEYKEKSCNK